MMLLKKLWHGLKHGVHGSRRCRLWDAADPLMHLEMAMAAAKALLWRCSAPQTPQLPTLRWVSCADQL